MRLRDLRITRWAGKDAECVSSSAVNTNSAAVWGRVLILTAAEILGFKVTTRGERTHEISPHNEGVLRFRVTH